MEDKWFLLFRDTMGIAGNFAELIGLAFLLTQFRRRRTPTTNRLKQNRSFERRYES